MEETFMLKIKNKPKVAIPIICAILGTLIICMTIFTFTDLEISKALFGGWDNAFGIAGYMIGYTPAILVNVLLLVVLFWYFDKLWLRILLGFLLYGHFFGMMYLVLEPFDLGTILDMSISGTAGLIFGFLAIFFGRFIPRPVQKKLLYILLIAWGAAVIGNSLCAIFQFAWGRDRYLTLFDVGAIAALGRQGIYTPWYLPQGPSGHSFWAHSFPSLHVTSCASALFLVLLAFRFQFKTPIKILLSGLGISVVLIVVLSRVIKGDHYMTDVTFALICSTIGAIVSVLVIDPIYTRHYQKKEAAQNEQPQE